MPSIVVPLLPTGDLTKLLMRTNVIGSYEFVGWAPPGTPDDANGWVISANYTTPGGSTISQIYGAGNSNLRWDLRATYALPTATWDTKSILLDGVIQYAEVPAAAIPVLNTTAFTISMWVKPDVLKATQLIGNTQTTIGDGWSIYLDASGNVLFKICTTIITDCLLVSSSAPLVAGDWSHIFVTYDGLSLASGANIYVNGVNVSVVDYDTLTTQNGLTADINLGKFSSGVGYFQGNIDEISFHDVPLIAADAELVYNLGNPLDLTDYGAVSASITSYYRMGEGDTIDALHDFISAHDLVQANMEEENIVLDSPNTPVYYP